MTRPSPPPEDPAGPAPGARIPVDAEARAHLGRAFELARRGWGRVHPNPMVGCVLVKGGAVVGEGWHREFGGPHAEVHALEAAGADARGATAYVSLEPCRHQGKTPACTDALVRAGVARVVYAVADPTAEAGGGGDALRAAGLEVTGPVWGAEVARRENPAFIHAARSDAPFVALKLALSLDGRIAAAPGRTTRLTGPAADAEVQRLRAGFDAILVGRGTAAADDPRLTVRGDVVPRHPPARVVLDSAAGLASDAALFGDSSAPVVVFAADDAEEAELERLEAAGATVHPVPRAPGGLDLGRVLEDCARTGLRAILCEGGGRLAASLLREGRVQRIYLFVAPVLLGPQGVPGFGDLDGAGFGRWAPAGPARTLGADTLVVLDREDG